LLRPNAFAVCPLVDWLTGCAIDYLLVRRIRGWYNLCHPLAPLSFSRRIPHAPRAPSPPHVDRATIAGRAGQYDDDERGDRPREQQPPAEAGRRRGPFFASRVADDRLEQLGPVRCALHSRWAAGRLQCANRRGGYKPRLLVVPQRLVARA